MERNFLIFAGEVLVAQDRNPSNLLRPARSINPPEFDRQWRPDYDPLGFLMLLHQTGYLRLEECHVMTSVKNTGYRTLEARWITETWAE